jgi:hypothetical protein
MEVKPGSFSNGSEGDRHQHKQRYMEAIARSLQYNVDWWLPSVVPYKPPYSEAFVFVNIADWLLTCVKIHLWFFNLLLKGCGIDWWSWLKATTKTVLPTRRDGCVQFFRDTYDKDNPQLPHKRPRRRHPDSMVPTQTQMLLLTAFSALNSSESPTFQLTSELKLYSKLRKFRGYQGMLDTTRVPEPDLSALRNVIHLTSQGSHDMNEVVQGSFTAIADSGCSITCTNCSDDFLPGTMEELPSPITLGGIAGGLTVTQCGQVAWETVDDFGNIVSLQTKAFLQEQLPCRLFSPQAFLKHSSQKVDDHFRVYSDRAEVHQNGVKLLTMPFDSSFLPRITMFRRGTAQATLAALNATLVGETNSNISPWTKHWLRWHYKLGHLGFEHVRRLGVAGYLDTKALNLTKSELAAAPKCAACCYGKQARKPDNVNPKSQKPSTKGALLKDQLMPGDRIFTDQLESRVRGRLLHTAGREPDRDRFCGSSIFYDAASGYIHVEHQVHLAATDTIMAKNSFERFAKECGVSVKEYHTDNGVYQSAAFQHALQEQGQSIRFSGVGAKWQNGPAENSIKISVNKARTQMIHAALHWPDQDDKSLWPLSMDYAVHLYNNTPNATTGISPLELFTGTKSDHSALKNAHVWGCPAYVLEPSLTQAGSKIPKWQPRSRRAQFVGVSPVHSESIGVVRNLNTGYITPQYHIVYDDWFETVHAPADQVPPEWENMCVFQKFQVEFGPEDNPPPLSAEWNEKGPTEATTAPTGRKVSQQVHSRDNRDDNQVLSRQPGPQLRSQRQNGPSTRVLTPGRPEGANSSDNGPVSRTVSPAPNRMAPARPPPAPDPTREPPEASPRTREPTEVNSGLRRSSRHRKPTERFEPQMKGKYHSIRPAALLATALLATNQSMISPQASHMLAYNAVGIDLATGFQEDLHPWTIQAPWALKAKASKDPDLPSVREAVMGPHAKEFWKAMESEISTLESMDTWEVVPRSSMPKGAKAIPSTWAFRIKRYPDGRLNKFKARFCVMGNRMEKGVHYFEDSYSPLVGWPTVRAAMLLSASHGWKSRQVDFTNAFCQAPQRDLIFVNLPQYYKPSGTENQDVVLKLKKSLYGQVTSPKLFWEHLQKGMHQLGFEQSKSDPCLFIHKQHKLMVLNYCDDQIWLSPDDSLIETYVGKLKGLGYGLSLEKEGDVFAFLGIEFKRNGSRIELTQKGLIDKVIRYVGLQDSNPKSTPAATTPLGTDKHGQVFAEEWSYPAAVGMLLYLSSNTRPDIQFAVHQVARFNHAPRHSHAQAIKRIVRYLLSTKSKGIEFEPNIEAGLDCYVDADFAGLYGYEDDQDPVSVKSRTGFVLTLFGCPIIWSSKLQTEITLSSTAAEYVAFSMAMRELLPMRALLQEICSKLQLRVATRSLVRSTVFEDNQGCLSMVNTPKMSARNKYLSLKYHFFRDHIGKEKGIEAKWIETTKQQADIFTKGLPEAQFQVIRKLLMGW